jgi:uncharacterized protein YndB with AHSA1/START domain
MARAERSIDATPEEVFAVLSDATTYPKWLIGARRIRAVDDDWPHPGSFMHHSVGAGPLTLDDKTMVVAIEPPRRLVLEARLRPLARASVEFDLIQAGTATHVVMKERLTAPICAVLSNSLVRPILELRNVESLRRLEQIVLERAAKRSGDMGTSTP